MIIIRKLLSLFLVLVVITSLSFTAFAAGEQPSGSNYQYNDYGTATGYDTYWTASNKNLQYIGTQTRYSNTYLSAIQSLVSDIKLAVDPSSSPAYSTPSGQNYNYYSFSDVLLTSNFWDAVNLQLQYISNRINSIKSSQATISNAVSGMGTSITSIDTNTSSINTKLPTGTYSYVGSDGTITSQSNSTRSFWSAMTVSTSYMGQDINSINNKLPSGSSFSYLNSAGNWAQSDFWNALAYGNGNLELWLYDLHTMFASPEDLALKSDQENNISAATTNFLSGSDSSTSVGTGSIGKVKDLGDDAAAWFDTGVQATSLFDALSNDDTDDGPWMWFTQATMDDLDSTSNNRSFKSSPSSGEYVPDLYGAKMDELDRMLDAFSE